MQSGQRQVFGKILITHFLLIYKTPIGEYEYNYCLTSTLETTTEA